LPALSGLASCQGHHLKEWGLARQDAVPVPILSWFPNSVFLVPKRLVPKLSLGTHSPKTPFHGKIAKIFKNLDRFGTTFQKVFCHSAKSQTPLAEYFSSYKTLKSNHLRRPKKVFCHSAKAQRKPKNEEC
jgi:hypothetical protein